MQFEVLVNDWYLKLIADSALSPATNKKLLSLLNDFEDRNWMYEAFENFIWDNIALTALSSKEREKLAGQSRTTLREAAKNLRLTDKVDEIGQGSELAEILLYGIMHHHYNALPVVPKIFYKQNSQDNAKGADSVHVVLHDNGDFSLWFGEAKFYNSIEDARLPEVVKSVAASLRTDKLKKENSIIVNTTDLEHLISDRKLLEEVKSALSPRASIDHLKPKINFAILLLHQCPITANASELCDKYRADVRDYHLKRAQAYFEKQVKSLSATVPKYADVAFHLILFPVPDRKLLVQRFSREAANIKG